MLVANVLPVGVRGMVVAGLLAALMSSLAGAFNAAAAFTNGLLPTPAAEGDPGSGWVWIGPRRDRRHGPHRAPLDPGHPRRPRPLRLPPGRPVLPGPAHFRRLLLRRLHEWLNAKGCLAALGTGFGLGLFRLAVDTPVKLISGFSYAKGSFLWIVNHIFFQYYSLIIFLVSVAVMIVVSYLTEPPSYEKISGLTYGTVTAEHRKESRASWQARHVIASLIVLALIITAYLYFTG